MAFAPTKEQQLAIETTDQSIVLSAGAGSGKTRVLVQRYLHILEERLATVDQILAITFTNKAAGEMKERIQKEVRKAVQNARTPGEKEFWRQVKEDLNRAQISTFHSFCGQVLRQDPLQAEIDPFFKTLEEIDAGEILNDSIEEILLRGLEEGETELTTIVREFGLYAVEGLLRKAYLDSRGFPIAEIGRATLSKLEPSRGRLEKLKLEIGELVQELLDILANQSLSPGAKSKMEELKLVWPNLAPSIAQLSSLRGAERKAVVALREVIKLKGKLPAAIADQIGRLKEILDDELVPCLADIRSAELIEPLVTVLQQIHTTYSAKKRAQLSLDFEDLQELTICVLKENSALRSIYREKYRFLMVDEFQDTNPVQEELIRLIIGGASDARITGNKLFIVGDPKQSIYRFRGADVTVFKRMQQEILANGGLEIQMNTNFRSRGKVIDYVNHCFGRIFGTSGNPYDMPYQPSYYARQCAPTDCTIEYIFLDKAQLKEDEMDSREEEANLLALRIQQMVGSGEKLVFKQEGGAEVGQAVGYGDICLLFQVLTNIQIYEEALQRYHIPYTVVKGRGFFERQEVRDIVNLLKLVDNLHREIEWVGVLRSPFVGLSDEELFWLSSQGLPLSQVLTKSLDYSGLSATAEMRLRKFLAVYFDARENRERKTLSLLISELLNRTGYLELALAHPYSDLVRANVEKFVGMARDYETGSYTSLRGFLKRIEGLEKAEAREGMAQVPGEENLVKLMSIHQSKGLEFPVVILPDIQRPLLNPANFPSIFFDPKIGLGMRVRDPLTGGSAASSVHKAIWEEEKQREIAERKRHFYVAATRARDYLLISGTAKSFKAAEIDEAGNWLEWLGIIFNFQTPDQLPDELAYGAAEEHVIRVTSTHQLASFKETAVAMEKVGIQTFTGTGGDLLQLYISPSVAPIEPRGKSGYYEFGVTSLLTYKKCPRWYYHQFVQHMPVSIASLFEGLKLTKETDLLTLFSADDVEALNNTEVFANAAERGTLIHFICERIQVMDELPELVRLGVKQKGQHIWVKSADIEELVRQIEPNVQAFLQRESELRHTYASSLLADEKEVAFNLVIGQVIVRGTIDRVLITPDELIIIDYKSNRLRGSELESVLQRYQLQMAIYALALHRMTGRLQIKCRLHFLMPNQIVEWEYGEVELEEVLKVVQEMTSKIVESACHGVTASEGMAEYFPCAFSPLDCPERGVCAYWGLCKDWVN